MIVKNLDKDYLKYSNNEVFTAIRYAVSNEDPFEKLIYISELINHITDIKLLLNTVKLVKRANLLSEYDDVFTELENLVFRELQYSETDITRILTFVVSGLLEYEIYSKVLFLLGVEDIDKFKYGINKREVHLLNLGDLKSKIKKTNAKSIIKKAETLNPKNRNSYLYKVVSDLQTIKYDEETNFFDKEIEYFDSYLKRFGSMGKILSSNNYQKVKTLKDIFKDEDDFEPCINELRLAEPPIINNNKEYLLGDKKKKAVVSWVDALEFKGLITKPKDDLLAELLGGYFGNFSIAGRSLRDNPTRAYEDYYKHFCNALPQSKE